MARFNPMCLEPVVKEVVWGGHWLADTLGRRGAAGARLGESWEAFSGSRVRGGPLEGKTIGELFAGVGAPLFGSAAEKFPRFPLLVKFIDAHQNLSVQVHPDDALALKLEGYPYGKTEFWYVLEAQPGAEIVYGLKKGGITQQQMQDALLNGNVLAYCARVPVARGDVVPIPAGTVHALNAGVVIYELQQDCDITYRLYDWGRTEREIHLEKGLRAIDFSRHSLAISHPAEVSRGGYTETALASLHNFQATLYRVSESLPLAAPAYAFALLTIIAGEGRLDSGEGYRLKMGDTLLLPAGAGGLIKPDGTNTVEVIVSTLTPG